MVPQLGYDVVSDRVALILGQGLLGAAHDLAGAHQGEGNRVAEHISTGHPA